MKQIKINQLKEFLVQKVQECNGTENAFTNIMLVASVSIEKHFHAIFKEIATENADTNFCFNLPPVPVYKWKNDVLVLDLKDGKKQYGWCDNDIELLNHPNSVAIWERFNWSSDMLCNACEDIIAQRKYTSQSGKTYLLPNLKMVVTTAYPNNGQYRNVMLSEDYLQHFDIYEVVE